MIKDCIIIYDHEKHLDSVTKPDKVGQHHKSTIVIVIKKNVILTRMSTMLMDCYKLMAGSLLHDSIVLMLFCYSCYTSEEAIV